ncbi:MAG: nodulation protein NfeD [Chloroflexi bacterium]|nr:nodulation protein NfeD [Chloroflexota bacterium]MBI1856432.1 nodulation protein NfeD [Chloroflexota bacterium]MBI3340267.1 nodulation protein NfeD [Chloroflexota bacterium]
MKRIGSFIILAASLLLVFQIARAQSTQPVVLILNANGPIEPIMLDYIERGIKTAEQRQAEALIIQLNTPGGSILTMGQIIEAIRASQVPVIVYVAPRGAWAASAGTLVTLAGHAAAMAPETVIGAASPVSSGGADLPTTEELKAKEATKAIARSLAERRGSDAVTLAEATIENAKAVSANEALQARLIDFIATDINDLLKKLNGFTVTMPDGPRVLRTTGAQTETVNMSVIEQLLLILTDSNIVFILLALGVLALQIELSNPGGWVAGFFGVSSLALAFYGMGLLSVNYFGLVFLATAFVLFILDIKAPTHGALTAAGIGSFIVGALVLFNSPGVPQFQRVSVPLVVGVSIAIGLMFATIMTFALRAQQGRIQTGVESVIGKTGVAKTDISLTGQVQIASELWSAEAAPGSGAIGKGDRVEVVEVKGLRLKVRKI